MTASTMTQGAERAMSRLPITALAPSLGSRSLRSEMKNMLPAKSCTAMEMDVYIR